MEKLLTFFVVIVGWIFSLCLHEFSHALVAYIGGDTTVREKGYLTFNPFKYTHPVYSLLLPLVFLVMGGIGLPGGAVYIETWRLRNRYWESAVSLAGPLSNLALAVMLAMALKLNTSGSNSGIWPGLGFLALLQISAMVLNLIPVPPFDGYATLAPFLNRDLRTKIVRYSMYITLIVFVVLWYVPFVNEFFWKIIFQIGAFLDLPFDLVLMGYDQFRFWK